MEKGEKGRWREAMRAFVCGPRGMGKQLGSEGEAWDENEGCEGHCPARVAAVDMDSCCVQVRHGKQGEWNKKYDQWVPAARVRIREVEEGSPAAGKGKGKRVQRKKVIFGN